MEMDWQEIQDFLIGEIRLREKECYKVTFNEYRAYLEHYEQKLIQGWRYVRFIAWRNELCSNIKPSLKKNTPEAFMPLKGDKKPIAVEPMDQRLTAEQEQELFRIIGTIGRS